jgi:hypothetical protein
MWNSNFHREKDHDAEKITPTCNVVAAAVAVGVVGVVVVWKEAKCPLLAVGCPQLSENG